MELLQGIEDNSIDLIFTDPPYKMISRGQKGGVAGMLSTDLADEGKIFKENDVKFKDWIPQIYRVLKNKSHCYIMINWNNLNELINVAESSGFDLQNILVWKKNNCTPSRWFMKNGEFIVMFKKGKAKPINNEGSKAIKEFENVRNKIHPTQKPIKLIEYFIKNSSSKNDLVLDPFGGVFTTAIASYINGRNFISFEKDCEYYSLGKEWFKRVEKNRNYKEELRKLYKKIG